MITEEQRELRKNGLGGSDIAAVLGVSPYATPLDIYLEKKGLSEKPQNIRMRLGSVMEKEIIKIASEKYNLTIEPYEETLIHPKHNFLIGHIDGYCREEKAIVEIKRCTSKDKSEWGEEGTEDIPLHYWYQVQHYMLLARNYLEVEKTILIVNMDDIFLKKYVIYPDEAAQGQIIFTSAVFWNAHVLNDFPPAPTTSKEASIIYNVPIEEVELANQDIEKTYEAYIDCKSRIKHLEKSLDVLKVELMNHLKNKTILFSEDGSKQLATWKPQNGRSSYDIKKLLIEHPEIKDLVEQYKVESEMMRVLRVKGE